MAKLRSTIWLRIRAHRWLVLVLLGLITVAAYSHYAGDKINIYSGQGWDGSRYGHYARAFGELVATRSFDSWYVQRILPSGAVWLLLKAMGKPLTTPYSITAFEILNLMMLIASAVLWKLIGRSMHLSTRALGVGFVGLFGNFAILKLNFYYPVLTDTSAFALGLLLVFAYVDNRPVVLFVAWLAGAFVFPSLVAIGVLLFLFPRGAIPDKQQRVSTVTWPLLVSIVLGFAWLGHSLDPPWGIPRYLNPIQTTTLLLGALLAVAFLLAAVSPLLKSVGALNFPSRAVRAIRPRRLLLAAAAVVAIYAIYGALSANGDQSGGLSTAKYLKGIYLTSHANIWFEPLPAVFAIAHLAYFGPAAAAMGIWWRDVTAAFSRLGTGAVLVALVTVAMAINSESRQLIAAYPLFVLALAMASEGKVLRVKAMWLLGLFALAASRFWMWIPRLEEPWEVWPAQAYFMNQGPWMSPTSYILQATVGAVVVGATWWALKPARQVTGS